LGEKTVMSNEIVRLANVSFRFGDNDVLENISLSIYSSDLLAILGPNGGGKTTLLKIILGILKPSTGSVKLFGSTPEKGRKNVGYLPQLNVLDFTFPINVFDAVLMGRYSQIARSYRAADYSATKDALEMVGMYSLRGRHISMLSGGQLQRILIARALVRNPGLLLLDEPMSGVDPQSQASFYDLINKLNEIMAVVFVTHDISAISTYFEKVVCLNKKLFYHGPKEGSIGKLEEIYRCPVEIIAHGIPHRVLKEH